MSTYTRELYPAIEPYASSTIQVDEIHCLYYEECGNPQGKPVVFLHGGPGGGALAEHVVQCLLHQGVEGRSRLIEHEQFRIVNQCENQTKLLAHTPRHISDSDIDFQIETIGQRQPGRREITRANLPPDPQSEPGGQPRIES